jgi:ABC-type cobalamin/Fe3+-siderophores transport system ATPase subunit
MILDVQQIHGFYGKSHILQGVTLRVGEGETVTLLGRNGAGKSTTLKSIAGVVTPQRGTVTFKGEPIHGSHRIRSPHAVCALCLSIAASSGCFRSKRICGSARARTRRGSSTISTVFFRASRSGARTAAANCPAASSRCSPLAAR